MEDVSIGRPSAASGAAGAAEVRIGDYAKNAEGGPDPRFLQSVWAMAKASEAMKWAEAGERYYLGEADILKKKRTLAGPNGGVEEYPEGLLSNARLNHGLYAKDVNQQVHYLLSKPFTISCADADEQEYLEKCFSERVRETIKSAVADAIAMGMACVCPYYDSEGNLRVRELKATELVPFWSDDERLEMDACARFYSELVVDESDGFSAREIKKCEFYSARGVFYYSIGDDGSFSRDESAGEGGRASNFYVTAPKMNPDGSPALEIDPETGKAAAVVERRGVNWGRVPLLAIRRTRSCEPLLKQVKSLIDEYDLECSRIADEINDVPNSIKVVKGYNGESLGEFTHNLMLFRAVAVQADGDVTSVTTPMDSAANEANLTRLLKDQFAAASAVDTTRVDNLGNQSGVAMRYIYSDLDMACNELWGSLENQVLRPLARYFLYDLALKTGKSFDPEAAVDFIANTDIAVNETETISNLKNSVGLISAKTIIENHPFVRDAREEEKRMEDEYGEELRRQREMGDADFDGLGSRAREAEREQAGASRQPKEITNRSNGAKSVG